MSEVPRPTDSEREILTVLWSRGASTVREVHATIQKRRPAQYTTILKLLQIMAEKGLVRRDEAQRAHVYQAAKPREWTQRQLAGDLLGRAFDGFRAQSDDGRAFGAQIRPPEEGRGETQTFPFQKWRYRHIQGVGDDIVIKFVGPEYRITIDPQEKAPLKYVAPPVNSSISAGGDPQITIDVGTGGAVKVTIQQDEMPGQFEFAGSVTSGSQVAARFRDAVNETAIAEPIFPLSGGNLSARCSRDPLMPFSGPSATCPSIKDLTSVAEMPQPRKFWLRRPAGTSGAVRS